METAIRQQQTLTQMREECDMTQTEVGLRLGELLGKKSGYTHARISQFESAGPDSLDQIKALAQIYGKPFDEVLAAVNLLRK